MAESSLSKLLRPDQPDALHHPLSPSARTGPRRAASFTNATREASSPTNSQLKGTRRHHAATVSVSSISERHVTEADLLGVGPSTRPVRRSAQSKAQTPLSLNSQSDLGSTRQNRDGRSNSTGSKPLSMYIDGLTKEEAAVVEMRFDLMSTDEIQVYLQTLVPSLASPPRSTPSSISHASPSTPRAIPSIPSPRTDDEPLFPPSPPAEITPRKLPDHPLGILSRAIRELKESVITLEEENTKLRAELMASGAKSDKHDATSIHDNLTEALSTYLTTPSPLKQTTSHPLPIRSMPSPTLTTHSLPRARSPASIHSVPLPSPKSGSSSALDLGTSHVDMHGKRNNRSSWTSGLWVWNKPKPRRKGSFGSIMSQHTGTPVSSHAVLKGDVEEQDEDGWRRGDGGSPPAFRAIFLATRIITPDPSSILAQSNTSPNSLVAYLAHALVSNARDEHITAKDPPGRRGSRSRSRATSVASQEAVPASRPMGGDTRDTKRYGDQALAVGRSLLSSVSNATLRGTMGITESVPRPSLLSRVSSSRPFPTTAISPPTVDRPSGSSTTSPTEETPPPSVELASIVPDESRPPTVLLSRQNLGSFFQSSKIGRTKMQTASRFKSAEPPLTDRYGFIYDIQHASMLKDAGVAGTAAPASCNGTVSVSTDDTGWIEKQRKSTNVHQSSDSVDGLSSSRRSFDSTRSTSVVSLDTDQVRARTPEPSSSPSRSSSHMDVIGRHRSPSTLMINPSPARPVTGKDHLTVSARGSSSLVSNASPTLSIPLSASLKEPRGPSSPNTSRATVSSLLDQLTDIHDRQQQDRKAEWDGFLRKRKGRVGVLEGKRLDNEDAQGGPGLIGVNQMGLSGKTGQEEYKRFLHLVRGGIPLAYRSDIWAECSGAKDLIVPGEYAEILRRYVDKTSAVLADIEKDVSRTFPGNVFFGGDGPGVAKLRRVLIAYSWHNPSVGYCQGMNMLAATLLLTHTDEEQAYWTLLAIIERLLPHSFFSPDLLASRADQLVLADLVEQLVPKVYAHLQELGVDLASVTFGWFLSLFTDCLPVETLFRVWDVFFVEGRDTLFRVAIAILKLNEAEILAAETVSDLFTFISGMTSRLWAADKLITLQHGYQPIVRHKDISERFTRHLETLKST